MKKCTAYAVLAINPLWLYCAPSCPKRESPTTTEAATPKICSHRKTQLDSFGWAGHDRT